MRSALCRMISAGLVILAAVAWARDACAELTSEVRDLNGMPALFVNGKLTDIESSKFRRRGSSSTTTSTQQCAAQG